MRLSDLSLEQPWALLGLVPVAAAAALIVWERRAQRVPAFRFSSLKLLDDLPETFAAKVAWLPDALRIAALALIVLGLARPQLVGPPEADESEGIDIVLALDTSCSMRAADFEPNDRMFVAKKSIEEFVLSRKTDRIGLVVFGEESAGWVPLTLDYSLVTRMIEEVEIGMIGDGTAIGNAIATSLNRLRESPTKSKVVVLMTDGDNNAGEISPVKAAEFAKDLGVRIYTVLIGRGGPVPFPVGKDPWGRVIYQQRNIPTNPKLLQEIAAKTGGEAYTAKDKGELDATFHRVLDSMEKTKVESTANVRPYAELFPWAVMAALVLIGLEMLLASTRLARFP